MIWRVAESDPVVLVKSGSGIFKIFDLDPVLVYTPMNKNSLGQLQKSYFIGRPKKLFFVKNKLKKNFFLIGSAQQINLCPALTRPGH